MKITDAQRIKDRLKKDICRYYQIAFKNEHAFIPGKTKIAYASRVFDEKELLLLLDAGLEFWLTAGRYAHQFEEKFADFFGVRHCLLTNSGSSANLLAVSALRLPLLKKKQLQPGDEVITTACGFPTTVNPIIQNNLIPVFVDIDLGSYNIRAELIKKAITSKTKAIFLAHTLGNPVDMRAVLRIAHKYGLWLIEDNCDSLGSQYHGKLTGTFGHLATSSFYPAHHITMGEGGAIVTQDPLLYRIMCSLRDWGRECWCDTGKDNTCGKRFLQQFGDLPLGYDHKYVYSHIGYNFKVTDLQAAIGCAQLDKLPGFIAARRKHFHYLYARLKRFDTYFILPSWPKDSKPSWFGFPILIKENSPFDRAAIVEFLERNKIATRMLFGGNLIKQPAYKNVRYRVSGSLKNTDAVMNNLFWVGVYPGLTIKALEYVAGKITDFLKARGSARHSDPYKYGEPE